MPTSPALDSKIQIKLSLLMTAYKSLLYLIIEAGVFALYVPLALLRAGARIEMGFISFLAIPLWLIGAWSVLRCFWDFTFKGQGTPAPIDPPKELVVTGFYRYVRNPIYVGVVFIFVGHFLWFGYLQSFWKFYRCIRCKHLERNQWDFLSNQCG